MTTPLLTGACLCGAVRVEVLSDPKWLTLCNCEACRRYGALWVHSTRAQVQVFAAPDATIAYSRTDPDFAFHSCKTCGVTTHWAAKETEQKAVNVRLVDPDQLAAWPVRHFDGAGIFDYVD